MMAKTGIEFPLVEADAGATGLPDASCDLVLSEYGASIWVDPYRWIPEAARLLRPGGRVVFLCNSPLVVLCSRGRGRGDGNAAAPASSACTASSGPARSASSSTCRTASGSSCCARTGFEVERLIEVQAPADAETHEFYAYVTAEWARQWPAEDIWVARKIA